MNAEMLVNIMQRIEKLKDERAEISTFIKEVFDEAKYNGYDTKVIKELLKIRAQDAEARAEHMALLGIYGEAIGINPFE